MKLIMLANKATMYCHKGKTKFGMGGWASKEAEKLKK
jgi:hypothetical protein